MRSYAKFQLDQQTRFCAILEKLMGGLHQPPPPVPARVNAAVSPRIWLGGAVSALMTFPCYAHLTLSKSYIITLPRLHYPLHGLSALLLYLPRLTASPTFSVLLVSLRHLLRAGLLVKSAQLPDLLSFRVLTEQLAGLLGSCLQGLI